MAGLLENYYEFFENEEEDFSSNDLSSITEQVSTLNIQFLRQYLWECAALLVTWQKHNLPVKLEVVLLVIFVMNGLHI